MVQRYEQMRRLQWYKCGAAYVKRTFLTSGRTLREHIANLHSISNDARIALLQIDLPKFVWVTELSTIDEFENDMVNSLLLIDATGNSQVNVLGNITSVPLKRDDY